MLAVNVNRPRDISFSEQMMSGGLSTGESSAYQFFWCQQLECCWPKAAAYIPQPRCTVSLATILLGLTKTIMGSSLPSSRDSPNVGILAVAQVRTYKSAT